MRTSVHRLDTGTRCLLILLQQKADKWLNMTFLLGATSLEANHLSCSSGLGFRPVMSESQRLVPYNGYIRLKPIKNVKDKENPLSDDRT